MSGAVAFPTHFVCVVLVAVYALLSAGQALWLAWFASRRDVSLASLRVVWGASLLACEVVAVDACVAGSYGYPAPPHGIFPDSVSLALPDLLLVGVASAALGIACVVGERDARSVPDVVAAGLLTPVLFHGQAWRYALILASGLLAFGCCDRLLQIFQERGRVATRGAATDALRALPVGVMCVAADGSALFMNEAMRTSLAALGMPGDLADQHDAWERIVALAKAQGASYPAAGQAEAEGEGVRVEAGEGRVLYVTREQMRIRQKDCFCLLAQDISEEDMLSRANRRLANELEQAGSELVASLGQVQSVAEERARLQVRSRVHDVIGQRLSILHRALEADDVSLETVGRLGPLLTGILDDLRAEDEDDPAGTFDAVIAAFRMAGLEIHVDGSLPEDPEVAGLFVRVAREACTNAIRHGQARHVWVSMGERAGRERIVVENDGALPAAGQPLEEHGGIGGMRRACAALGGTLDVRVGPRFCVIAEVPAEKPSGRAEEDA
ncbi:MAG: hypothetical protein LKG38_00810 [Atopobiaceae bacterium]|jgi:two-component sensor histidine kinase|nr:hypothetical protein [Atopobiaceae bacterium]MCH4120064.1 hypothetical protein [Atopobiaceae bacterium]MCI1317868.1 hypothetical protein [Atopobiaceae bacterium]MCI1388419.1 hypothetical protein [Atopobiaceae bacterium]MCI1431330.1 hypothetical protein [Atopobiaceae bacterium]